MRLNDRDEPPDLTDRQRDVYRLMAAGLGARRIAKSLCISRSTAQEHMEAIARKITAANGEEAA